MRQHPRTRSQVWRNIAHTILAAILAAILTLTLNRILVSEQQLQRQHDDASSSTTSTQPSSRVATTSSHADDTTSTSSSSIYTIPNSNMTWENMHEYTDISSSLYSADKHLATAVTSGTTALFGGVEAAQVITAASVASCVTGQGTAKGSYCRCNDGFLAKDCSMKYEFVAQFGRMNVKWNYDSTNVYVQILAPTQGWMALMLGASDGGMLNGDCWHVWMTSAGVPTANDRYSIGYLVTAPPTTSSDLQNLEAGALSGNQNATHTWVSVRRAFDTKDARDKVIPASGTTMTIGWALGQSTTFGQHGATANDRGGDYTIEWRQPKGPPSAPTDVKQLAATTDSCAVTWTLPARSGSGNLIAWSVQRETIAGNNQFKSVYSGGMATSFTDTSTQLQYWFVNMTGLTSSSNYSVKVAAQTDFGGLGPYSVAASCLTLAPAQFPPSQMAAPLLQSSSATTLTINWTAPATNGAPITFFQLRTSNPANPSIRLSATRTQYTMNGLQALTSYNFSVQALSVAGPSIDSMNLTATTLAYPACSPSPNCYGHGTCFQSQCLCQVGWVGTFCQLRADFHHCESWGSSLYPNNNASHFCMHWTYDDAVVYVMLEATTLGWVGLILSPDSTGGMNNGDAWMLYVLPSDAGGTLAVMDGWSSGTLAPTTDSSDDLLNPRGYEDSTTNSTIVWFKRSLNTSDDKDKPITNNLTTVSFASSTQDSFSSAHSYLSRGKTMINFLQPKGPPIPPGTVWVYAAELTKVTIRWLASPYPGSGTIMNYTISRDNTTLIQISPLTAAQVSTDPLTYQHTITGLQASTNYTIRVAASNDWSGLGDYSGAIIAATLSSSQLPPSAPPAPTLFQSGITSLTVSWLVPAENGSPVTGYTLKYQVNSKGAWTTFPTTFPATTPLRGEITGLTASTSYAVKVTAQSLAGSSNDSPALTTTTLAYSACLNSCSGRGTCVKSVCQCQEGYLGTDCSKHADFNACDQNGGGTFCLYWSYDTQYLYVMLSAPTSGWVGLLIGTDVANGMLAADAWMGDVTIDSTTGEQTAQAQDMYSATTSTPTVDAQQDLLEVMGYETTTPTVHTYLWFKRLLNTTDMSGDDTQIDQFNPMHCSWSFGPVGSAQGQYFQHAYKDRGRFDIDFLQPKGPPSTPGIPLLYSATTTSMTIQFSPSAHPGSGGVIISYTVERESTPGSGIYVKAFVGIPETVPGDTVLQVTFGSLIGASMYMVRVYASNEYYGDSVKTDATPMTTLTQAQFPPDQPLAPEFLSNLPAAVTMKWLAPKTNQAPITGFKMSSRLSAPAGSIPIANFTTFAPTFSPSSLQGSLTGLTPATSYDIRVLALSVAGPSNWSAPTTVSTAQFSPCPNACSGHGTCMQSKCRCDRGWLDVDCGKEALFTQCSQVQTTGVVNQICLRWAYDNSSLFMQIDSYTPLDAWFGLIVGHEAVGGMVRGDCWSFLPVSSDISTATPTNVFTVQDRYSSSNVIPTLDITQDLLDAVSFIRTDTGNPIAITFSRLLSTGHSDDQVIKSGMTRVSWAVGSSPDFKEHAHTLITQGKFTMDFLQAYTVGPPTQPLFQMPIVTQATNVSVKVRFFSPLLLGSSSVSYYDVFLFDDIISSYLSSDLFRSDPLPVQYQYANTTADLHVIKMAQANTSTPIVTLLTGLTPATCYSLLLQANNAQGGSEFTQPQRVCTLSATDVLPSQPSVQWMLVDGKNSTATTISTDPPPTTNTTNGNNGTTTLPAQTLLILHSGYPTIIYLSFPFLNTLMLNSSTPLVGYIVEMQTLDSNTTIPSASGWQQVYNGYLPSVNITGLTSQTYYAFHIISVNTVGESPASDYFLVETSAWAACPGLCSDHGLCSKGVCYCDPGWLKEDCSMEATVFEISQEPYFAIAWGIERASSQTNTSRRLLASDPSSDIPASSNDTLHMTVSSYVGTTLGGGWSGLIVGGSPVDGMSGGDTWFFVYDSSSDIVRGYDRYSPSQSSPAIDVDQVNDLEGVVGQYDAQTGLLSLRFKRRVLTGDTGDIQIENTLMDMSWATGDFTAGSFNQHSLSDRGKLSINFYSSQLVSQKEITLSYFYPLPIAVALFCILAISMRNIAPLRRSLLVRTILHQPLLRTLMRPFQMCQNKVAPRKGFRQKWFDVLTFDVRRVMTELTCGEFFLLAAYGISLAFITTMAMTAFEDGGRAFTYFWGDLTALHLALALFPVARSSIFLLFCGISFERAVKWHRWVSRVALVCLLIHAIWMLKTFSADVIFAVPVVATPSGSGNILGFMAGLCMCLMSLMAIEPMRRQAFRLFYYTHLLLIIPVYTLACIHSTTCFYLCITPGTLYIIDRLLRFSRGIRHSEIVGMEVIDVDIPDPVPEELLTPESGKKMSTCIIHIQFKQEGFTFQPGQYIFVNIPQISLLAWHPFSISCSNHMTGLFSVHILARRADLEELRRMAAKFRFGVGVGLRGREGVVAIGALASSGNQHMRSPRISLVDGSPVGGKKSIASFPSKTPSPPPIPASKAVNKSVFAPFADPEDDIVMKSPPNAAAVSPASPAALASPSGIQGRTSSSPPPLLIGSPQSMSRRTIGDGEDGADDGDIGALNWEADSKLNAHSWTSELLIRSMRYFARCSSFVDEGGLDPEAMPPPPVSVRIDGPYGNINIKMKEDYHTLVLVAGGIGVTPFFSILYDLLSATSTESCPIELVHLVWVCSDANVFSIVHPALWQRIKLNPKFRLHFYATRNPRRALNAAKPESERFVIKEGRPDWRSLFQSFTFADKSALEFARHKKMQQEQEKKEAEKVKKLHEKNAASVDVGANMSATDATSGNGHHTSSQPSVSGLPATGLQQVAIEMQTYKPGEAMDPNDHAFADGADVVVSAPAAYTVRSSVITGDASTAASVHTKDATATARYKSQLSVAAFVCGPSGMVSDIEEQCAFHQLEFHKEVFAL